jgi:hypothetical protein
MKQFNQSCYILGLFWVLSTSAQAAVTVVSWKQSHNPPQPIGKKIIWTAAATDSGTGPLTFQFWVTPPGRTAVLVKDFNVGTLSGGTWTSQPFVWVPTGPEGLYAVEVVVKEVLFCLPTAQP